MNNTQQFSLSMRLFHWAMAAGLLMVRSLEPWQLSILTVHKAFGVVAAALVIARLMNRLFHQIPALPGDLSSLQTFVAKASHWLLYLLLFAMPISGYLMQYFAGRPIDVFGWFRLPSALTVNIENYAIFRELHGWLAIALMALVALHVAAALHHHFIRKDTVLKSML